MQISSTFSVSDIHDSRSPYIAGVQVLENSRMNTFVEKRNDAGETVENESHPNNLVVSPQLLSIILYFIFCYFFSSKGFKVFVCGSLYIVVLGHEKSS